MVVLSAALLAGAVVLGRNACGRFGAWSATLIAAASYIVAVAVVMLVLPTIDETPGPLLDDAGNIIYEGFPADDLYLFRLYSLGTQVDHVGDHRAGVRVDGAAAARLEAAGAADCMSPEGERE